MPLIPNRQSSWFRFVIFSAGRQPLRLLTSTREGACRLRPKRVLALWPDEACEAPNCRVGPASFWWIAINVDRDVVLPGMAAESWRHLRRMLMATERRLFAASQHLCVALEETMATDELPANVQAFAVQASVQRTLIQLLRDAQALAPPPLERAKRDALGAAMRILNRQLHDPPSWSAIASSVGAPAPMLWQLFKQALGHTPMEYLNVRRIARATRLMREERLNLTEIAHAVGFSTSQYFAVVFRRLIGTTPTEYSMRAGGRRSR